MVDAPVTVKLRKVGGSVVVSIPRRLLEEVGLTAGDKVELRINEGGNLELLPII